MLFIADLSSPDHWEVCPPFLQFPIGHPSHIQHNPLLMSPPPLCPPPSQAACRTFPRFVLVHGVPSGHPTMPPDNEWHLSAMAPHHPSPQVTTLTDNRRLLPSSMMVPRIPLAHTRARARTHTHPQTQPYLHP